MQHLIKWVGLDVHKRSIVVAILAGDDTQAETLTITNEPRSIKKLVKKLRKEPCEVAACYEAGPCGYTLHRQLQQLGVSCDVIAPSLIPVKAGDRIKTDRKDARKLASLYRAGMLTTIHIPDEDQEALRDLVRAREDLTKEIQTARQHLLKFLDRHGWIFTGAHNWTQAHWTWLRKVAFEHPAAKKTFEHYRSHLEYLLQRRGELDAEVEDISQEEPYREAVGRLGCLRGVNTLTAMTLIAELIDFKRFGSPREFTAYLGLVPSERSTGGPDKAKRGGITKTGNVHARRVLLEASWHYRHQPTMRGAIGKRMKGQDTDVVAHAYKAQRRLHRKYWRMVHRGKPTQVATTAVARELAGFVWALMNEAYPGGTA